MITSTAPILLLALTAPTEEPALAATSTPKPWSELFSLGTVWYLHGTYGEEGGDDGSRFYVGRVYDGYSLFAEAKWPAIDAALFGRYEVLDWGRRTAVSGEPAETRMIAGCAWRLLGHNALVFDLDAVRPDIAGAATDWQAKLTLAVVYP